MSVAPRHSAGPYGWSLALHAALLAGLGYFAGLTQREVVVATPIQAVVVNDALLEALDTVRQADAETARQASERQRREEQALREQERLAAQTLAQERAQAAERTATEERRRAETEATVRAEARRRQEAEAEARRKADAAVAQRRQAEADAAATRKAENDARAREQAERQRQAEEARTRAQRETDLRARLADEEQRTAAVAGGLRSQYVAMIQARIQRNWIRPASARSGLKCTVRVTQIPGGEVVGATLGTCNGDEAVRQSIVSAVLRSSPLPAPPDPSLFERNLVIEFVPED